MEEIIESELNAEGYVLYRKDRKSESHYRGGGIMILVKASLKSKPISKLNDSKFQDTIWCQIELNQSKLIVGVCYRSTASSAENNEELLKLLKQATVVPLGTQILIMGDFNYPDIDYLNVDDGLGSGVGLEAS